MRSAEDQEPRMLTEAVVHFADPTVALDRAPAPARRRSVPALRLQAPLLLRGSHAVEVPRLQAPVFGQYLAPPQCYTLGLCLLKHHPSKSRWLPIVVKPNHIL